MQPSLVSELYTILQVVFRYEERSFLAKLCKDEKPGHKMRGGSVE